MGLGTSLLIAPKVKDIKLVEETINLITTLNSILGQLDIKLSEHRDALRGTENKTLTDLNSTLTSQLDIKLSELKATGTETPRTLSNLYDQLASILGQLDITLSSLRDAIRGADNRTLTDLHNQLTSILGQLDITLSSFRDAIRGAGNRTLTDLYNKAYDSANDRVKIKIEDSSIMVPVDIQGSTIAYDSIADRFKVSLEYDATGLARESTLSTRASESTLLELKNVTENLIPPITVPSGYIFVVPAGETKYVADNIYADGGDVYLDGDLFII